MISECHKSEIEKWEIQHITVELERAQRVDLVDMCPAFDFVLKRLDIRVRKTSSACQHCCPESFCENPESFCNKVNIAP